MRSSSTSSAPHASSLPLLVVISGAPGAGKTTLARLLSRELRLPLLSKDRFKEPLMDALGAPDREASRATGRLAYDALYRTLEALVESGSGAVVESNFVRGFAEDRLAPLLARASAALVLCEIPAELARARYAARAGRGERHAGHFDLRMVQEWDGDVERHRLALHIPTLTVDTTDGYRPELSDILLFISRLTSPGSAA